MLVSQLTLLNLNKQQVVKKQLEKIELDDIQPSSRRYPFVKFTPEREIGNDLLIVQNLSKTMTAKKY
ncbi:ABC transporter ATP-binding protein uup [Staphylococcus aureus]|uniref:ABC transporter ATP-binding protein uup n=1 Tax=Staphylococcus aureus TaxID=1280 RepID=A0A380E131_STAAU|nr:ABC transporter ATP-binding protein uup [Staphylococcus aureus]